MVVIGNALLNVFNCPICEMIHSTMCLIDQLFDVISKLYLFKLPHWCLMFLLHVQWQTVHAQVFAVNIM